MQRHMFCMHATNGFTCEYLCHVASEVNEGNEGDIDEGDEGDEGKEGSAGAGDEGVRWANNLFNGVCTWWKHVHAHFPAVNIAHRCKHLAGWIRQAGVTRRRQKKARHTSAQTWSRAPRRTEERPRVLYTRVTDCRLLIVVHMALKLHHVLGLCVCSPPGLPLKRNDGCSLFPRARRHPQMSAFSHPLK